METKQKKGFKLMGRIACVMVIPLVITVIIACISGINGMNNVSEVLMKEELHTAAYAFENIMDDMSQEDYSYENGTLHKGEFDVTANENMLEKFKSNTGVDISIIIGKVRAATTMTDASGNNLKDQPISDEVYAQLQQGQNVYDDSLMIGSNKYYVFYFPLKTSSGEIYGSVFAGYNRNAVEKMMHSTIIKLVSILCGITVVTVLVMMLMLRSIGTILGKTVGHLEEVADGSLDINVQNKMVQRSDELGEVARSLQKLIHSLTTIVGSIIKSSAALDDFTNQFKDSFRNIKESIENINTAVDEIANGATHQAGDTQKANEEVIQMGNAIDATSENIISLTDSSKKMSDYNQSANEILRELLEISEQTNASVDEIQKQTDETNRSAMEIQEATELIADIASQTNLLSLNASIEAARAGEQGRGFAVVAEEIRTLADQCRESADKISNVVNELISNSNQSVHTMDNVMKIVGQQNEKLENTLEMFDELNQEISVVSQAIGEISSQMGKLGETKNEVMELLESLSAIAQENAASTEETSASMMELSDVVEMCNEKTEGLVELSSELKQNTTRFTVESIKEKINL